MLPFQYPDLHTHTHLIAAQPHPKATTDHPCSTSDSQAIDCFCLPADKDPLTPLRAALAKLLPEAQVLQGFYAGIVASAKQGNHVVYRLALPCVATFTSCLLAAAKGKQVEVRTCCS